MVLLRNVKLCTASINFIHLLCSMCWTALQRQNTEISKQIFPEKEYRGLSLNFRIHMSVSDLYITTIGLPILLKEIWRPILGLYKSLKNMHECGNWGWGRVIPRKGIYKWDFRCSVGKKWFFYAESDLWARGSQRDVVYVSWPTAPSYMSPNGGGGGR